MARAAAAAFNCRALEEPPVIPFFALVMKDLAFLHEGNDTVVDGLINFEKLRMLSKQVRQLDDMRLFPFNRGNVLGKKDRKDLSIKATWTRCRLHHQTDCYLQAIEVVRSVNLSLSLSIFSLFLYLSVLPNYMFLCSVLNANF